MNNRMRLTNTKTIEELEIMHKEIQNDPDSQIGSEGIYLFNKEAIKKMEDIEWAVYSIMKEKRK